MKTSYILPAAGLAFGLWACGDDDGNSVSKNSCATTEQCIQEAVHETYGENVNLDSLLMANPAALDSILQLYAPMSSSAISGDIFVKPGDEVIVHPGDGSSAASSSGVVVDPTSSVNEQTPASSAIPGSAAAVASSGDASVPASAGASSSSTTHNHHGTSSSSVATPASSANVQNPASSAVTPASSAVAPVASGDFVEDHRSECQIGNIQTSINNAKLPDPFTGLDGKRISSKADWKCRREEIGAIYEKVMFGEKPRKPEKVEGKMSGNKYSVTITDKGKTASFSVSISSAGTADKPKPALIGLDQGFGSCGSLGSATSGLDIAMITFNTNDLAPENSPSGGAFGKLYSVPGTIIAWAWGVSRLIDALEKDPSAGIDVKHLAVTGCSRLGKAALAIGAFDERIALTIPQESGSGGASLWRVGAQVNKQKGKQFVQGLNSAGSEGNWMIGSFKSYDGKENTLPMDQHMLTAMVAPRALLIIDNAGQEWLGEVPSNYCGQASKEVFDALGATDNYTYTQEGGHGHCQLPNGQFDEVKDFINKFLLGKDVKTGKIDYSKNTQTINWSKSEWIDWETPTLN